MPKKPSGKKPGKPAGKSKPSATTKGCCLIEYDNKPEDQYPGKTQAECRALAKQKGGTAQWTPGACAEK
jgi:hypothetical protein